MEQLSWRWPGQPAELGVGGQELARHVEIARLLFVAHKVRDRDQLRRDLLAYCERDTWAMVRLLERLRAVAGGAGR